MINKQLDLEKLLEGISDGRWYVSSYGIPNDKPAIKAKGYGVIAILETDYLDPQRVQADAELLAAARQLLYELIDARDALKKISILLNDAGIEHSGYTVVPRLEKLVARDKRQGQKMMEITAERNRARDEIECLQNEVHRLRDELIEIGGKARSIYYSGYQHGDALNIMLRIQAALAPKTVEREKLQP